MEYDENIDPILGSVGLVDSWEFKPNTEDFFTPCDSSIPPSFFAQSKHLSCYVDKTSLDELSRELNAEFNTNDIDIGLCLYDNQDHIFNAPLLTEYNDDMLDQQILEIYEFPNVEVFIPEFRISHMRQCVQSNSLQSTLSISSNGSRLDSEINKNCVYEVEKVMESRKSSKSTKTEYFLKWKNYSYNVSSWETGVNECAELLGEYKKRKRTMDMIATSLKNNEKPLYKVRCMAPTFFLCQRWEDELNEISTSNGQGPIFVENWVDINLKLKNFKFITVNKITNEVRAQFQEPKNLMHCQCSTRDCGSSKNCCPDIFGMKFPYTSLGRVRKNFDCINEWIVECGKNCACGPDCATRVVQRGRQIPIVIFRTVDRGWSVRTMVNIPANTFVMEYIGLVITLETAKKSIATYQFEMDACHECAFVVDALNYGNEARFVNHSCNPNLLVRGVFCDRYDKRYHRIAYFAARDINKGEEITINYFSKFNDDEFKKLTKNRYHKSCFCNASNCRGYIV